MELEKLIYIINPDRNNDNVLQILVGGNFRQWLRPVYFRDSDIRPISSIKTIVPDGPNNKNMLIDACIAFAPTFFKDCHSLDNVQNLINKSSSLLDFNSKDGGVPKEWVKLREQAKETFDKLKIYEFEF